MSYPSCETNSYTNISIAQDLNIGTGCAKNLWRVTHANVHGTDQNHTRQVGEMTDRCVDQLKRTTKAPNRVNHSRKKSPEKLNLRLELDFGFRIHQLLGGLPGVDNVIFDVRDLLHGGSGGSSGGELVPVLTICFSTPVACFMVQAAIAANSCGGELGPVLKICFSTSVASFTVEPALAANACGGESGTRAGTTGVASVPA